MAIEIISTDDLGDEGNNHSTTQAGRPVVSADGRYVVFQSDASDLVDDDTNGTTDIFVRDRQTGTTERVSVATGGAEAHGSSAQASISADGRYVVFASSADDLVVGDTNGWDDIFLHDRQTGTTTRVSIATGGGEAHGQVGGASVSADGRYVVFESFASDLVTGDTNNTGDIFLHDTQTGTTTLISRTSLEESDGQSTKASISADGRYVTFQSDASNLVAGDTNFHSDIFIYDTQTDVATRIDPGQGLHGGLLTAIEAPGGPVIWSYFIRNAASLRLASDILYNDGVNLNFLSTFSVAQYTVTNDELLMLIDDINDKPVFKFYVPSVGLGVGYLSQIDPNTEEILSVQTLHFSITDDLATQTISADGRYVVFSGAADNLVTGDSDGKFDIFLRDTQLGTTTLVAAELSGRNLNPSLSADGRFVVFENTTNPFGSVGDIYVTDVVLGTTAKIAPGSNASISADGQTISFVSGAGDLVPDDTNNRNDVFVSDNPLWALRDVPVIKSNGGGNSAEIPMAENTVAVTIVHAVDSDSNQTLIYSIVGGDDAAKFKIDAATGKLSFLLAPNFESPTDIGTNNIYEVTVQVSDGAGGLDTQDIAVTVTDVNEGAHDIRRVSLSSSLAESNGGSENHASGQHNMSANGHYIVFWSLADNLVANDTNNAGDIFLRDTWTGKTTLVSTGAAGQGNDHSFAAAISANGRYVVFQSEATNLVAGDTNGSTDIFLRDLKTGITTRLSTDSNEVAGNGDSFEPSISANGRYIVFQSSADNLVAGDTNGVSDIFLRDTVLGTTTLISTGDGEEANGRSFNASISADGRFVTYESVAHNLVASDPNDLSDIFLYDRQSGITTRIESGANAPSPGGTVHAEDTPGGPLVWAYVMKTFESHRLNSDIFYDPGSGLTIVSAFNVAQYSATTDVLYLLIDDINENPTLEFRTLLMDPGIALLTRFDATTGETLSVKVLNVWNPDSTKQAAQSSMSSDGRYVVYEGSSGAVATASNIINSNILLHDTVLDTTIVVSTGLTPSISGNGRFIVFRSDMNNLVDNDTNNAADVFVKDMKTGAIALVSTGPNGQGDAASFSPTISADGRTISFLSDATNLVEGDTNDARDLFVVDNPLFLSKLKKGSQHADVIKLMGDQDHTVLAKGGNDTVRGLGGNDEIHGGKGNDYLVGGIGKDDLFGDGGKDLFAFRTILQSSVDNPDVIHDFRHGKDKIDLRDIDPVGAKHFHFIGNDGFAGHRGELRFDAGSKLVQGDVDGDGRADFAVLVDVGNLTKADFLL